jgi:hypothetical protein
MFACEADAQQALRAFAQGLQVTRVQHAAVRPLPRDVRRGRPSHAVLPAPIGYQIDGALGSLVAAREALVGQHRCVMLATNELDEHAWSPQALLEGDKGQTQAERGFRFLKEPLFLASSLSLKKPQRIMALLMVMTVWLLVYAALEYRIRQALRAHQATFPNQKGQPIQNPTARWVFQTVDALALLLAFGSATTWHEDLHLARSVPCLAHTLGMSRAVYRVSSMP